MVRMITNIFSKTILCGMVLLIVPGCNFAPFYERPCVEMPESWRVTSDDTSTVVNVRWWEQMDDPVLNDLIHEALVNNMDLRVAAARIQEFQARVGIVFSSLFPQITAQATASRTRYSQTAGSLAQLSPALPAGIAVSPYLNDYLGVINASYELDIWGKLRNATYASLAELLAQVEAQRTVILTLVTSVANAYIQLRQYDMQLEVSIQTMMSRLYSYELAKLRFEEGLTSELEVKQAASELDTAEIEVIRLQTFVPQQENLISVLIGHPPSDIMRGRKIDQWRLPPEIPAGIPADILEQRPDILEAEERLIAANLHIGEARALFFPDITLTGYYGTESAQLHHLFTDPSRVWQWAGNLLQPIFEGGRLLSTLDLTNALKREAYYNYQQTVLNALKEVNNALIAHSQSKIGLIVEYDNVKELQDYLYLARLQYDNGQVDYLNVLDAERRLFAAQLDLATAQATVFQTFVNIYKALGGGWVVDAENIMREECAPLLDDHSLKTGPLGIFSDAGI